MLIFILMKPGIPLIKPFKLGLSCGFSPRTNLAVCLFRGRPRPNVLSHLSLDSFILYIQWSVALEGLFAGPQMARPAGQPSHMASRMRVSEGAFQNV